MPGTGLEPASREAADFRHTASFDAGDASIAVRALDYAFAVGVHDADRASRIRRPPSSLYTFREAALQLRFGLGSALPRRLRECDRPGGSPNLKGSAPVVSGRALNCLSPLCLPISSPRQGGRDSTTGRAEFNRVSRSVSPRASTERQLAARVARFPLARAVLA